jgi:hypothetical protein
MSSFSKIFDVFSRRPTSAPIPEHVLPISTRNRIFMWCIGVFGGSGSSGYQSDYRRQFWEEISQLLKFRHGKLQLFEGRPTPSDNCEDAINFLKTCNGTDFLDFIEYIFRVDCIWRLEHNLDNMISELNELLLPDNLPYYLTSMIIEEEPIVHPSFPGASHAYRRKIISYPKIIMKENEAIHQQIIIPALTFLQRPVFTNANKEYLEALEDFRKKDYGDCLTKCGSSFESVMKVICDIKKWKYSKNDTAAPLVKNMVDNLNIPTYLTDVLTIIATLRNKHSKSHGAGSIPRNANKSQAEYALNSTASAILFLAAEAGER